MTALLEDFDSEQVALSTCGGCGNAVPETVIRDGVCPVCRRELPDDDDDDELDEEPPFVQPLDFG